MWRAVGCKTCFKIARTHCEGDSHSDCAPTKRVRGLGPRSGTRTNERSSRRGPTRRTSNGIGKTTLVKAFLDQAVQMPSVRGARGQCLEHYGAGEAYLPVLDLVSRLCRSAESPTLEPLRERVPAWLAQMPTLLPQSEREELQARFARATRERMSPRCADWEGSCIDGSTNRDKVDGLEPCQGGRAVSFRVGTAFSATPRRNAAVISHPLTG